MYVDAPSLMLYSAVRERRAFALSTRSSYSAFAVSSSSSDENSGKGAMVMEGVLSPCLRGSRCQSSSVMNGMNG